MAAPATGLLAIIPPPGVKGARIGIVYHSVWGFRASIPIPALSPRRLRRESAEPAREQAGPLHINPNRGGKPMALTLVIGNKKSIPPGRCGPGWPCARPEFPSRKSACRWRARWSGLTSPPCWHSGRFKPGWRPAGARPRCCRARNYRRLRRERAARGADNRPPDHRGRRSMRRPGFGCS